MKGQKKLISILLAWVLIFSSSVGVFAEAPKDAAVVQKNIAETAKFMMSQVPDPQVGSVAGEWTVMSLARSGEKIPQSYYDGYYDNVVKYVQEKQGILHTRKYTEYSRVILALTAIGKDPTNVGGYNLLEKLGDYENVLYQGINGPIFALITLDSGGYDMPTCKEAKVQATREKYIQSILNRQIPKDGGFSLEGIKGDPDITGMALQALSRYQEKPEVKRAVGDALKYLSAAQKPDGGYESWGSPNSESVDQVIMALTALGIDPNDPRFVKNGHTLMDNLLTFYGSGGGFMHVKAGDENNGGAKPGVIDGMATDQGMYAMIAYHRFFQKKNTFYNMTDVHPQKASAAPKPEASEKKENAKVHLPAQSQKEKTFADIQGNKNQKAIEALASRGIVSGFTQDQFAPEKTMTRSEFCAAVVRALGLKGDAGDVSFADVPATAWYAPYVHAAYNQGIVKGVTETTFQPQGTITREEAAAMLRGAAKLCGMDTDVPVQEVNLYLPQFPDYPKSAPWARESLTFAVKSGIISPDVVELRPKEKINRGEIAQMIYNLLKAAKLLAQ